MPSSDTDAFPLPPTPDRERSRRRGHPVRRRITVVIISAVTAALLVTGLGTLVLIRVQARQDTRRDLIQLATNVRNTAVLIRRPVPLHSTGVP